MDMATALAELGVTEACLARETLARLSRAAASYWTSDTEEPQ